MSFSKNKTVIYNNENIENLETILQKAKDNNQLSWFEIHSEIENVLYCFRVDNGLISKEYRDIYNELLKKYKNHTIENYAITGCNFQTTLKKAEDVKSIDLKDSELDLILYLISYAQSEKEEFKRYLNIILAKDYSKDEIKNMIDELRKKINIEKYK